MIQHVEISLRLSPRAARTGMAFAVIGAAHFINRRFDEAVPKLLLAIQEDPNSPAPYCVLASAMRIWGAWMRRERLPHGCAPSALGGHQATLTSGNPEHRELFLTGLRLAMGEVQ